MKSKKNNPAVVVEKKITVRKNKIYWNFKRLSFAASLILVIVFTGVYSYTKALHPNENVFALLSVFAHNLDIQLAKVLPYKF